MHIQRIRNIFRGRKTSVQEFAEDLRKKGARIGGDLYLYCLNTTWIDSTAPWLLTIGDHVRIAAGVIILTHDYSWSVLKGGTLKGISGSILGAQSPVSIGSSVFIGMNAIITRGVTIGDNVIIGAGSVVTRDCPSGGVYAGNPARYIMSVEAYYEKRLSRQFEEAKQIALQYRERLGKNPPKEIFDEYFPLFCTAREARACPAFRRKMELLQSFEATQAYLEAHPPKFADYESFLKACYGEE